MTVRFGKGFMFAWSLRGIFLKIPGMGQLWVGRDEVAWNRVTRR